MAIIKGFKKRIRRMIRAKLEDLKRRFMAKLGDLKRLILAKLRDLKRLILDKLRDLKQMPWMKSVAVEIVFWIIAYFFVMFSGMYCVAHLCIYYEYNIRENLERKFSRKPRDKKLPPLSPVDPS